jgi:hypothetical protein
MNYDRIKHLAKERGCRVEDLIVLARPHDPFYGPGTPSGREKGQWFADLWRRFDIRPGAHLRRIHYLILSPKTGEVRKPDGTPYANTDQDWEFLNMASKYARHLGLVDPRAIVDQRNPEPHLYLATGEKPVPKIETDFPAWALPAVFFDDLQEWELPTVTVSGYDYGEALQPYHVEIWVEKSTQDDILAPLCERYGVNLVTGIGFMTISSIVSLMQRVAASTKPVRIFYIADFDPAGDSMPTAVARQIEFLVHQVEERHMDIKLTPLLLTREQVERYQLPRIPVKKDDKRRVNFEKRHGEGAVELDALEGLYPGELAAIVRATLLQFRDNTLADKIEDAHADARHAVRDAWAVSSGPYQEEVATLHAEVAAISERYKGRFTALENEMNEELRPYQEKLDTVRRALHLELEHMMDSELPFLPEPEMEPETDEWLYDSSRDYFTQLAAYKARKQGSNEEE